MKTKELAEKTFAIILVVIVIGLVLYGIATNLLIPAIMEGYKMYGILGGGIAIILFCVFFVCFFYMIKVINWAMDKILK